MRISVVVPTLNEADAIGDTLDAVIAQKPYEVIVSDGGSSDQTIETARHRAKVVSGPTGRSVQMNTGAAAAAGDMLLFLHADTRLPDGGLRLAAEALSTPGVTAGCFRIRFEPNPLVLWIYSQCTRLPLRSICFGDRALFVRKAVFEEIGGFAEIPIFEDLDIVRRLRGSGSFAWLPSWVTTSARRFVANHPIRQQARNISLWLRYQLGVSPERLAPEYGYDLPTRG